LNPTPGLWPREELPIDLDPMANGFKFDWPVHAIATGVPRAGSPNAVSGHKPEQNRAIQRVL
jgi:hypothetical protein